MSTNNGCLGGGNKSCANQSNKTFGTGVHKYGSVSLTGAGVPWSLDWNWGGDGGCGREKKSETGKPSENDQNAPWNAMPPWISNDFFGTRAFVSNEIHSFKAEKSHINWIWKKFTQKRGKQKNGNVKNKTQKLKYHKTKMKNRKL